jgi:hypothetical protein
MTPRRTGRMDFFVSVLKKAWIRTPSFAGREANPDLEILSDAQLRTIVRCSARPE